MYRFAKTFIGLSILLGSSLSYGMEEKEPVEQKKKRYSSKVVSFTPGNFKEIEEFPSPQPQRFMKKKEKEESFSNTSTDDELSDESLSKKSGKKWIRIKFTDSYDDSDTSGNDLPDTDRTNFSRLSDSDEADDERLRKELDEDLELEDLNKKAFAYKDFMNKWMPEADYLQTERSLLFNKDLGEPRRFKVTHIALYSGKGEPFSMLIKAASTLKFMSFAQGYWSHIGVVAKDVADKNYRICFEATGSASQVLHGIPPHLQVGLYDTAIQNYNGDVGLRKIQGVTWTDEMIDAVTTRIQNSLGKAYERNPMALLRSIIGWNKQKVNSQNSIFCSEEITDLGKCFHAFLTPNKVIPENALPAHYAYQGISNSSLLNPYKLQQSVSLGPIEMVKPAPIQNSAGSSSTTRSIPAVKTVSPWKKTNTDLS